MNSQPRTSLRRASTIGLALIVLLLCANVLISQWNIRRLVENENRVIHTQEILTTLEEVLASVTEAETAERGYLITGDPDYLRSHQAAIDGTEQTLKRLQSSAGDEARARTIIDSLEERVQRRFDELRTAIAAQQTGGFDAARQSVSTNQGRRLMNEMRSLVDQLKAYEHEALQVRSDESQRSAQATTLANFAGAVVGIGLVALSYMLFRRELAHRRRAGEALQRLGAIVESSDDAIISKSMEGIITSWNAGATRVYGYTPEEMLGRSITVLCPPERVDEVRYHLDLVHLGTHLEHFETTRVRKDGRRIDVSLSISPIKDESGTVIGASSIARDVSRQKLLEREVLEIAAREQQRIGQDLHDGIGQELTGLAMMAERLAGELGTPSRPEAHAASLIVDGLEQALAHVRALSKGLVPVELDAEGLMAALTDLAERANELSGVHCSFRCDEPVCIVDNQTATHLYRLSQESVSNALKHSRAQNIVISLVDDGKLITLRIADDGIGISSKKTTGMGLQIMRYRAELIRAKLTVARVKPHGTEVVCELPRQDAAAITQDQAMGAGSRPPADVPTGPV